MAWERRKEGQPGLASPSYPKITGSRETTGSKEPERSWVACGHRYLQKEGVVITTFWEKA